MEQITAKEIKDLKKIWYSRNPVHDDDLDDDMFFKTVLMVFKDFASLRSVSETKEPDGYIVNDDVHVDAFFSYKEYHQLYIHHDLKRQAKPVYFSPVPVSEVGQMEEVDSKIEKLCALVSPFLEPEHNRLLKQGIKDIFSQSKSLLPVPNTKTQEATREEIEKVVEKYNLCTYENRPEEGSLYYAWITRFMLAIKQLPTWDTKTVEGEAIELLKRLFQLKQYKEVHGKDDKYLSTQPILWKEVETFLLQTRSNEPERGGGLNG